MKSNCKKIKNTRINHQKVNSECSLRFDVLSLFPDYFDSPLKLSVIGKAIDKGLIGFKCSNIRDHASKKGKVDDRPYGGGPGMVLMAEPVIKAIRSSRNSDSCVVYLSPQGEPLTAELCREFSNHSHIVLLCGHYEGIDERVMEDVDREVSIGDYVLTSGAPAALVFMDAVSRFVPGVIGNDEAVDRDSFEKEKNGQFDGPTYTRPPSFQLEGDRVPREVPPLLMEGHHRHIERWREKIAEEKTARVRPDLRNK